MKDTESERAVNEEDKWLDTTLPVAFVEREFEVDVRDGYLVRELYIFVPFLLLFLAFSLNQISIEDGNYSVGALRESLVNKLFPPVHTQNTTLWETLLAGEQPSMGIDKTFYDIENEGDWNDWFRGTMETLFHCPTVSEVPNPTTPNQNASSGMPFPLKGMLYPLGAVRVRTQRMRPDSCSISKDVVVSQAKYPSQYNITDFSCYARHFNDGEEKTPRCGNPFNYTDLLGLEQPKSWFIYESGDDARGSYTTTDFGGVYSTGGYTVEVPFNASCAQAMQLVDLLQVPDCAFVDGMATRLAIVELFFYTPTSDTFFSAKLISEVTAGGGFVKTAQLRGFIIWTKRLAFETVLDFLFLTLVLYYIGLFFVNMKAFYHNERSVLRYFLNLWVVLEFANVVIYLAVFIMRWLWWGKSATVKKAFPWPPEYPDLDGILLIYTAMRSALAFNFILTFLKTLKYLKISSKLNVVSVTFEKAQQDVAGLLLIFVLVNTGYSIAATVLFGTEMADFRSVDQSFASLLFMLLGQTDYQSMKDVSPILAPFFFWTFLILCFFLLLNFIVAVVGDAFAAAGEQEWTVPLAEAFQLSFRSVVRNYAPRATVRECRLLCRGRSSLWLRAQAVQYIKQNHVFLKLKFSTALDIPVKARHVLRWIPPHLRDDYRELLMDDWDIARRVYELRSKSDDESAARQQKTMITEGARAALSSTNVDAAFDDIRTKVLALDSSTRRVIARLRSRLGKDPEPLSRRQAGVSPDPKGSKTTAIGRLRKQQEQHETQAHRSNNARGAAEAASPADAGHK